ncbi:hypothetical protein [Ketobacter alkanivorans]|uniref:Uncharacterized protein n=1 Tax=Ketobacter alkanivorans TaxID=1917421 RepID=A0A2K9LQX7_9GAMM|nr:hypothetical protein [Ketobacter alkanivorans]AUM14692.1 hypothetical protein Kalk_20660 [Ketobacter alkanivorans]
MDVIKTLRPGDSGTKKLTERYGDRLVCVRYRKDDEKKRRYTTIELIVDEGPIDHNKLYRLTPEERALCVGVYVSRGDFAAKKQVIEAGGIYDRLSDLWRLPLGKVVKLGMIERLRQG